MASSVENLFNTLKQKSPYQLVFCMAILLWSISPTVLADSITKPYTFNNDTTADATQVNANFDTLYTQVNKIGLVLNIDDNNNRVGINNTNPTYPLEVAGTIQANSSTNYSLYGFNTYSSGRALYAYASNSSGSNFGVYSQTTSTNGRAVYGFASNSAGTTYGLYGIASSTAGRAVYGYANATSGTNYAVYGWTRSGDGFAGYFTGGKNYFQGNVGIGDTTPSYKLDVVGSINTTVGLCIAGVCKTNWDQTSPVGGGTGIAYYDDGDFGIGTDVPETLLHLKSSLSEDSVLTIENTDADTNGSSLRFRKTKAEGVDYDTLGMLEFYGKNSGGSEKRFGLIRSTINETASGYERGNISILVYDDTQDEEINMLSVDNNGVGIGTSNPIGVFQVNSRDYSGTGTVSASSGGTTVTGSGTSFSSQLTLGDEIHVNGVSRKVTSITDQYNLGVNAAWPENFSSQDFHYTKPLMVVETGGDVGIGTTNPTYRLQVEGLSYGIYSEANATSGTTYAGRFVNNSSAGRAIYGFSSSSAAGTNYGGYFAASGTTARAVYGYAGTTTDTNYGGYFEARGDTGQAVYGTASSSTTGVNYGGYFKAAGTAGRGIYGEASNSGTVQNYGGYFKAAGSTGRGIYAWASNTSGVNYAVKASTASSSGYSGYFQGGKNYFQGRVGIADTSPSVALDVIGSIYYTGTIADVSDLRYKKNIKPLSGSLEKVTALRGVSYDWRRSEFPQMKFEEERQIGVIAQEVEKVVPQLVKEDNEGYKSVAYVEMIPLLIESIKELKAENDALKNDLKKLRNELGFSE